MKTYVESTLSSGQVVTITANHLFNDTTNYRDRMNRLTVVAPLPETVTISTGNEVNAPWDFMKFKSTVIQTIAPSLGKNFDRGVSERQFWRSIENQEMTIELTFNAYHSGQVDVLTPIQNLMFMGAPKETSAFGGRTDSPVLLDEHWDAPPLVNIAFGDFFYFRDVIFKNVSATFSNKLDNNFDPMSGTCSITFIPSNPTGYHGLVGDGDGSHGTMGSKSSSGFGALKVIDVDEQ